MSLARDLADLAGEANGISNSVTANSSAITALSIAGESVSPVQSFRNKIINGNFDIWQRGTSTSTAGYLADRWFELVFGSTFTSSRQSLTLGQTDVPGEPTYYHRTVVTSVAGASNYVILQQKIESVRMLAGQTATLSFWAKADASKNIAVEFAQNFGTGGSPSSTVNGIGVTTCALTTSWQKFTVTVSISSISGKTLGSDNNNWVGILIWFDAGSTWNSRTNSLGQQSGTFDIAQVQLEAGPVATPFEVRPPGVELALCQRYYWEGDVRIEGYNNTGYKIKMVVPTKQNMRAAPTTGIKTVLASGNVESPTFEQTDTSVHLSVNITSTGSGYYNAVVTASAEL